MRRGMAPLTPELFSNVYEPEVYNSAVPAVDGECPIQSQLLESKWKYQQTLVNSYTKSWRKLFLFLSYYYAYSLCGKVKIDY